jgi:Tol biopolymer transport system component
MAVYQRPPSGSQSCLAVGLWIVRTRGGVRRLLTRKLDWWSWAQHGDRLAFSTHWPDSSQYSRLFVTTPTGRPHLIAAGKGFLYAWSPNGRWLAFSASGKLTIVRADGFDRRVLAHETPYTSLRWSPDSRRLFYLSAHGPNDNGELILIDRTGQHRRQLAAAYAAAWSADGGWIEYYAHSQTHWRDIHVVRPDGSGDRVVSSGCERADWSPRGELLLISYGGCGVVNGDLPLWVVDPSSGATLLRDRGYPVWAPTGNRLAITHVSGDPRLTLVDADGTDRVDVSGVPPTSFGTEWSPSGDRLAFVSGPPYWVSVVSAEGTNVRSLAAGEEPTWSPGGQRIAYSVFRPGCGYEIWILRLRTEATRRLLSCL